MVEIWSHVPKHDLSTISLRGVAQGGFVATDHHFVRYHGPEASDRQHHHSATCANFGCASTRIFRVVCRGGRHAVVTQLGLGLVKRYCPRLLVLYSGSERFPADTGLSTLRGRSFNAILCLHPDHQSTFFSCKDSQSYFVSTALHLLRAFSWPQSTRIS